jgi:hypothetical protein
MKIRPFRLSEDASGEARADSLDWKPFSLEALPTSTSGMAVAEMDQVLTLMLAARQQPGHVISYVLRNQIPIALKCEADTLFYATPSPEPDDFAMAGDVDVPGYPRTALESGAQGNQTNYSKDDLKGNGDAQDRTEADDELTPTYSGQAGATDRGEAFELVPVETEPRMAGEDGEDARDYVSGFGNAENISEDTDYRDIPTFATGEVDTDRDSATPPDGKELLTEPSEQGEGWDLPWGEPAEGYRKVGVGESLVKSLLTSVNSRKSR